MACITEGMGKIAEEVLKILKSQYAVSLKALYDTTRLVPTRSIEFWAEANECQIDAIVSVVLGELRTSPYALEVIRAFCKSIDNQFICTLTTI